MIRAALILGALALINALIVPLPCSIRHTGRSHLHLTHAPAALSTQEKIGETPWNNPENSKIK